MANDPQPTDPDPTISTVTTPVASPNQAITRNDILKQRLLSRREIDPVDGCWNYTGYTNPKHYGKIHHDGKVDRVHRLSYELFVGPIPPGLFVLHSCKSRRCFNPEHLGTGTHQENMDQMVSQGRSCGGERHPRARLTEAMVIEIRRLAATGTNVRDLARCFSIQPYYANKIIRCEAWKHI